MPSYFIPPSYLYNLRAYRYSGTDHSLLSKHLLTPYWNRLVLLFPETMAPNLITLIGLLAVCINFASLLYFQPTLICAQKPLHVSYKGGVWDPLFPPSWSVNEGWWKRSWGLVGNWMTGMTEKGKLAIGSSMGCPSGWLYVTWAIGLFFYQSMDAIDGKQARRTGASGPLGEMFDHGCDALNTTLEVLLAAAAMNLGFSWWTVASQIATLANFYLTTWEEYHTGTLYLSAFSGPVEGILMICVIYLITAFKGPGFWDTGILSLFGILKPIKESSIVKNYQIPVKDLPLNDSFMVFALFGLLFNIFSSYTNVVKSQLQKRKEQAANKKNTKKLSALESLSELTSPLLDLLPFVLHTLAMTNWLSAPVVGEYILRNHLIEFILFWGISFAYQVGLMITAHTTKQKFPHNNGLMILSFICALDANLGVARIAAERAIGMRNFANYSWLGPIVGMIHPWFSRDKESAVLVVRACLVAGFLTYAFFVYDVVGAICQYLDINCLTIKHLKTEAKSSSRNSLPSKRSGSTIVANDSSNRNGTHEPLEKKKKK